MVSHEQINEVNTFEEQQQQQQQQQNQAACTQSNAATQQSTKHRTARRHGHGQRQRQASVNDGNGPWSPFSKKSILGITFQSTGVDFMSDSNEQWMDGIVAPDRIVQA
jgi:hypothetical protein